MLTLAIISTARAKVFFTTHLFTMATTEKENIAVLYGTWEGHTATVASHVAYQCLKKGHDIYKNDIKTLDKSFSLSSYTTVFITASIHMGSHQGYVADFCKRHADELNAKKRTAFLSISLSEAECTEEGHQRARSFIDQFVQKTGWKPDYVHAFGGALLYSQYGFFKRRIAQSRAPEIHVMVLDDHVFTDWESMNHFVDDVLTFT